MEHHLAVDHTLGSFLRQLRTSRRVSQGRVARLACVGRSALAQWENGTRRPHESALNALLGALQASPQQCQHAQELLRTARRARTRSWRPADPLRQGSAPVSLGPVPHHGDLLCALRLRRGLSQSEAAARVGVTPRTLRRWEKLEIWPSNVQLQTLCYALGAELAEMQILMAAATAPTNSEFHLGFLLNAAATPAQLAERARIGCLLSAATIPEHLAERAQAVYYDWFDNSQLELRDLHFYLLERLAWPHALRSEAGRCALAHIYTFHASFLSTHERWSEAARFANRALDVWPSSQTPAAFLAMAATAAARAAVYRSGRPTPRRGIDVLRHWVDFPFPLNFQGWILGDLAKYMAMAGDVSTGLALAQQSQEVMATDWEGIWPGDAAYRALDHAQILLWDRQYTQALHHIEVASVYVPAESLLLETEVWLSQGQASRAQERVEITWPHLQGASSSHVQEKMRRLQVRL